MPRTNLRKTKLTLTVQKDILEAAREYIPNTSHFFEDPLLEFLRWVNHPVEKSKIWARGGLNPGPCAYQAHALTRLSHGPTPMHVINEVIIGVINYFQSSLYTASLMILFIRIVDIPLYK